MKGQRRAFHMGLAHGCCCPGCCWPLMLLWFCGGVMNVLCVGTIFILIGKTIPWRRVFGRAGALVAGMFGIALLIKTLPEYE